MIDGLVDGCFNYFTTGDAQMMSINDGADATEQPTAPGSHFHGKPIAYILLLNPQFRRHMTIIRHSRGQIFTFIVLLSC